MRMPKMTGLELHQHLVASNRAIPTILMTAYPDERARAQAIKANVVCYLIKPFAADELLACVRRAVQRHDAGGEQPRPQRPLGSENLDGRTHCQYAFAWYTSACSIYSFPVRALRLLRTSRGG